MSHRTLIALVVSLAASGVVSAQSPHTMTPLDLVSMDRVSDPQVSPDGRRVAYVISALDLEADRRRTDIWMVDVEGGSPQQLTNHPAGDFNPRWSPDGDQPYFLSTRSGASQVWRLAMTGESLPR